MERSAYPCESKSVSLSLSLSLTMLVIYEHLNILAMFCYNLHSAQPEEDLSFVFVFFPSHRASTPALLTVWSFRLGFCTAL
jgi:hypothetical protein